jgi:hypothetical protein
MELGDYIEYEKRFSIGIEEGQKLLEEVSNADLWQKRTFSPSDIYVTEINTDYWASRDSKGPSARVRYYLISPDISPELYIEHNTIKSTGYLLFDADSNPETDMKSMIEFMQQMNFVFMFSLKERHRFFSLEHTLLHRNMFKCCLSEVIYVFEGWKDIEYEFGYEPYLIPEMDMIPQQEVNLRRVFNKYLGFKEPLKKRFDVGVGKYMERRG